MHRMPQAPLVTYRRRLAAAALAAVLLPLGWIAGPAAPGAQSAAERTGYIVQLADPPLASYRGGIAGLAPTNPEVLGLVKLDVTSPASLAYLSHLTDRQDSLISSITSAVGRDVDVLFTYRHAVNGIATELSPTEADVVRALPGVIAVRPDFERQLLTDAGPALVGAPEIWNGTATAGAPGTRGEGVVVGVIDTGINIDHPSFAAVGGDGYQHTNPRGRYYGLCAPLGGAPFCNDKLIGVHDFTGTTPLDDNDHGSHTAATAAGNVLPHAQVIAPTTSLDRAVSGVAPHANLITYKACLLIGSCLGIPLVAAIDQAVADGVDVLNYSIGGGPADPWDNLDAQAFLAARDAGILAVASAGNSGPEAGTIGSPANAPWILAVGASTHDRVMRNSLTELSGGASSAPAESAGSGVSGEFGPAPMVYAGDFGDALCQNRFLPGTFRGEIVVCDRGVNPRVEKGQNVALGGAGGMVLANGEAEGETPAGDPHALPAVAIGFTDGERLKEWLSTGTGHRGHITATTIGSDPAAADEMGGFSSRGPNVGAPDILKPDVTAPGVDILAAVHTEPTNPLAPPEFAMLSGTSMSGPHAAGAAALVRAVHPDWTPAQVVSAIVSTGRMAGVRKDDGQTPADAFDAGAGRIDLTQAARAGLVLDVTTADFEGANPALGGDPSNLNLATLAQQDCRGECSWLRTVTSMLPDTTTWRVGTAAGEGTAAGDGPVLTVKPEVIELAPGESAALTVTADVADLPAGQWAFGTVTLTPDDSAAAQHLPVAVLPGGAPKQVEIEADSASGSQQVMIDAPVSVTDLSSTVFGLRQGEITRRQLPQSTNPLDPYENPAGTFHVLVEVPEGAPLFSAEIVDTTALDLDLYLGLDSNGDGQPDPNEQVCVGAGETALESCRLENPEGGSYWVLVKNFLTGQGLDDVALHTVLIPPQDHGNLTVTGPDGDSDGAAGPVRAEEPLPVELRWDEPSMEPGTTWFGLVRLNSAPERDGDVGSLLVRLNRSPH